MTVTDDDDDDDDDDASIVWIESSDGSSAVSEDRGSPVSPGRGSPRTDLGAIMRALRPVRGEEKTPEDVLDERWPSWRNLAVWRNNSCHADVVLDVVSWWVAWCSRGRVEDENAYDHEKRITERP